MAKKSKNKVLPYDDHRHIPLEGGGVATVSTDAPPELIKALHTLSNRLKSGEIKLKTENT